LNGPDWYENVPQGSGLFQGQIIRNFELQQPTYRVSANGTEVLVESSNIIVVTQSCDLARPEKEADVIVQRVLVAPVIVVSPKFSKSILTDFPKFKALQYHWLPADDRFGLDYSIVSFSLVNSVPFSVLREHTNAYTSIRLRPPFAEHFASRFGGLFSRIGLPEPWYNETEYKEFVARLQQATTSKDEA
jgi:hypothetical protein